MGHPRAGTWPTVPMVATTRLVNHGLIGCAISLIPTAGKASRIHGHELVALGVGQQLSVMTLVQWTACLPTSRNHRQR